VDYKEDLEPAHFAVFSRMRKRRKELAEADGRPAYAVCTDSQLAAMAAKDSLTVADLKSIDGIAELAGILNEAAVKVAAHGMFTGYHAHAFDAADVEGTPAWFRLFGQVAPEVIMQMDVGNYFSGDGNPIAAMRTFPNRARTVHVKDRNAAGNGAIGQGEAPVVEFLELCGSLHDTEWCVVEECAPGGLGFEVVTRAYEALRGLMGV